LQKRVWLAAYESVDFELRAPEGVLPILPDAVVDVLIRQIAPLFAVFILALYEKSFDVFYFYFFSLWRVDLGGETIGLVKLGTAESCIC
jgi:hypothetical protein